ncbi:uncharacterized protein LOC131143778 isoform X2 [Malania oleifera]|uniref:uncharacterized protein LOC131143778 isoform X2 n=1 Tax=Malania oleifera TaxID=397392 RepID=UPI0025ADA4BE|nr:uncharacterized protein LOC131143778 isoform X2 [Malania oleifera]XP_057948085.1 uncharacterized protein LOC131143778 isoform X2 [Malania oleifera]XP_057948086.1 uncharacterized protein LOC131143778 isoform X2 [Malania oleifera]XP_057948087.1 uncharacterized protein LOC131143778 isoform X2 [Malania oleifera]
MPTEVDLHGKRTHNFIMEHSKSCKELLYDSLQYGSDQSASLGFVLDSTSSINTNTRPPELGILDVKPVLNYSIQTGEEFALEFMRDRVNTRKAFIPNNAGEHNNYATGYMDLRGILGNGYTGSDGGSDISVSTIVEKGLKEFEGKNSLYEDRSNHDPMQSVEQNSSGNGSGRGDAHGYDSSRACHSFLTKMKILCSFGGKILPRPSDGKLRYVGGETHIICISKNISWDELKQKTLTIFNQARTIKYQLPGEDLDALVSVSCHEDLQNMMEECNTLEETEGSTKLRMFLFSRSDLDDAYHGLGSLDGDSEVQYVVAVNGMDIGSRENSTLHGLAKSSASNLDELDGQSIEGGTGKAATDSVGTSTSPFTGNFVASSIQPTRLTLPGSSNAYENHAKFRHDQVIHHGKPPGKSSVSMPICGNLTEGHAFPGLDVEDPEMLVKKVKLKSDGSVQPACHRETLSLSQNDYVAPLEPKTYDGEVMRYVPVEEATVAVSVPGNERKHQEHVQTSLYPDVNPIQGPICNEDDHCHTFSSAFARGHADSESDPIDLSYLEPPALPQRVFNSERIPREQSALLNRLSKSDDSLGSQLLLSHSHPDTMAHDPINQSTEKLHNGNQAPQNEQFMSTAKPLYMESLTIDDGLAQLQKYRVFADAIGQKNKKLSADESEFDWKQKVPNILCCKDAANEGQNQKADFEMTSVDFKNLHVELTAEAKPEVPVVSEATSLKHDDNNSSWLPEPNWDEMVGKDSCDENQGHVQTFAWVESSMMDASEGEISHAIPSTKQGDILIDINDRFPRDFLSDIFSKEVLSEDSSGTSVLHKDGVALSLNMENHEPQHWSFFQKLAQDGNVSLIDQNHIDFSSGQTQVDEVSPGSYHVTPLMGELVPTSHVGSQTNFSEDNHKELPATMGADSIVLHSHYNRSMVKGTESMEFDGMSENLGTHMEHEDGKFFKNIGLPPLDPSLEDLDINTLQVIKNDDLEELKELGSGTFGTVYHEKWRGTDVAIKRIKKSCFTGRSSEQERLTIEFWREADILSKLHHPNVVAFYGVVQDELGETLATVTEYMVDGSLRRVLLCKDRYLDCRKRLIIAMDAAFGMEYLHSKNIVHFDLKCDNLLVNMKDPLRPICKVGDFGLSKIKRNTLVSGGVRGTLPWMAPELLNGSSIKVSEKVDVFSFGIVLWEILTGEEPYANMHYGAIIGGIVSNTLRPTIPSFCDTEWRILMEQCWDPNPAARPSFTEIARRLREMSVATHIKPSCHKASK